MEVIPVKVLYPVSSYDRKIVIQQFFR